MQILESKVDRFDRHYEQIRGRGRPRSVLFSESGASILSKTRGFLGRFDYTMQLQVGCPGGCLFCYVSSAPRLAPVEIRNRWGFEIRHKKEPIRQLKKFLNEGKLADKTIYWSGVTDPYATKGAITKGVWRSFCRCSADLKPKRIVVQSRFRPDRDADLMAAYFSETRSSDGGPSLVISFSIGTDRNDLIHSWERATPTYEQRMRAIQTLCKRGLFVVPTLSPFGLWNDVEVTLRKFQGLNVPYITILFLKEGTRYANTPRDFVEYIRDHHPFLLEETWQADQLSHIRSIFGEERVLVGKEGFASLVRPPS